MSSALLRPRALWRLIRASVIAWSDDYAPSMGAALAYYTTFSMAPVPLSITTSCFERA